MAQYVTDETGQQHEFPDEATPEMIAQALNLSYGDNAAPSTASKQTNQDDAPITKNTDPKEKFRKFVTGQTNLFEPPYVLAKDALSELGSLGSNILGSGPDAVRFASNHPLKALQNVGAGGASLLQDLINLPGNLPAIEEHLGMKPPGTGELSKMVPKADFAKYLMPDKDSPEQQLIRQFTQDVPLLGLSSRALKGTYRKTFSPGDKTMGKKVTGIEGQLDAQKTKIENAKEQLQQHQENLSNVEDQAREDTATAGATNPSALRRKVKEATSDIQDVDQAIEEADNQLQSIKPVESLSPEVENAGAAVNTGEANLEGANNAAEQAINTHDNIESMIGDYLYQGKTHDVEFVDEIKRQLEDIKKDIQEGDESYKSLRKNLEDKKVVIKQPREAHEIIKDIWKVAKEGGGESKEYKKLIEELSDADKREVVPANQFVRIHQAVNGYLREAREKAWRAGDNVEIQDRWKERAKKLEDSLGKIKKKLKSSIGDEDYNLFNKVSGRWRDEVAVHYKNPLYHEIYSPQGRIAGKNIIEKMRGPNPSNVALRNLAKNNPEAMRHLLGQRYKASPESFHKNIGDDEIDQYAIRLPDLQSLLSNKRTALSNVDMAKKSIETAKSNLSRAKKHHKSIKDKAKSQQERMEKSDLERADLQKKIKEMREKRKSLSSQIKEMESHINALDKARKLKSNSLKEKMKLERAYRDMKQSHRRLKSEYDKTSGVIPTLLKRAAKYLIKSGMKGAL